MNVQVGPKCNKKISPTPLHHQQPEPLMHGRMDLCFHVVYVLDPLPSDLIKICMRVNLRLGRNHVS